MRAMRVAALALVLIAACGEPSAPPPPAAQSRPPVDLFHDGAWRTISKPRGAEYPFPGQAFWDGERVLMVSGSQIFSFDPGVDSWRLLAGIPQAEECEGCGYGEMSVWTGKELILWGGGFSHRDEGTVARGVVFDPDSGTISAMPEAPIDVPWYHTAVWTGSEMIVWGGSAGRHETAQGAAFDPASSTWRRLPDAPHSAYAHSAVWTGSEMIVWGGSDDIESEGTQGCPSRFFDLGAAYDPKANSWRVLADSPLEARGWHVTVWTGSEMIVWGGGAGECSATHPADGAAYDPAKDSWRIVAASGLAGREESQAVWTGTEMILWSGTTHGGSVGLGDGAAYDPSADEWASLPPAPLEGRRQHTMVWTGTEVFVWGGCCGPRATYSDGAAYRPASTD